MRWIPAVISVQDLMDMGVEIEFFPLRFEDKDWRLRRLAR